MTLCVYNIRVIAKNAYRRLRNSPFEGVFSAPYARYTPPTTYEGGAVKCSELTSLRKDKERRSTVSERE